MIKKKLMTHDVYAFTIDRNIDLIVCNHLPYNKWIEIVSPSV